MLLAFACIANLLTIGALYRLRWVMQRMLEDIREYEGKRKTNGDYTIVRLFGAMLLLTPLGSAVAAKIRGAYLIKRPAMTKAGD